MTEALTDDGSGFGLAFQDIVKEFPGVRALGGVSFGVARGSVHALLGENGAGKSTLLKILAGVYAPTSGNLVIEGKPQVFTSTAQSLAAGVAIIHQELHLVPEMTVAENLFLGHLPANGGFVARRQLNDKAAALLATLGESSIDPRTQVKYLSIGQRQMVEIGKALSRNARIIAFDEPTSSLSNREVDRLFQVIADLKTRGHVIMYVTHRMKEIFEICDAATVLRDGAHVVTFPSLEGITADTLIQRMVGRNLTDIYNWRARPIGDVRLCVTNVEGRGICEPTNLTVSAGEIVGMFGLVGAGRSELMKLIYGGEHRKGGTVEIDGVRIKPGSPSDAIRNGLVFCPEDRKKEGIFPVLDVRENINISARRRHAAAGFFIRSAWERQNATEYVQKLGVRTPSIAQAIVNLSGGNQQKAILARWLSENIRVIIMDEPTRGIDVGAKSEIYSIIYSLAQSGIAVVVVSSELPEILGLSDRVIVMNGGRIMQSVPREAATQENLLALALPQAGNRVA